MPGYRVSTLLEGVWLKQFSSVADKVPGGGEYANLAVYPPRINQQLSGLIVIGRMEWRKKCHRLSTLT